MAQGHWAVQRKREEQLLIQRGMDAVRIKEELQKWDRNVAGGVYGLCMKGSCQTDFVECRFLCAKWNGREGASVATEGRPVDLLPDELRDKIDGSK